MSDPSEKTLCALQEEKYIDTHRKAFLKLIQPAKHFCQHCGRSAVHAGNLCKPAKL